MDRKPSSSSLLLALAVGLVLCTGLAVLLQEPEAPPVAGAVSVELTSAAEGMARPPVEMGPLGPIERDPIVFPDGPSYDWIQTGAEEGEPGQAAEPGALPPVSTGARASAGQGAAAGTTAEGDALDAYLAEVDFALQSGAWWSDSHALAQQVLSEAMSGEAASVGDLRRSNAAVLERVADLEAPPEAREHQRATLEVLRASDALLSDWQAAVESGDLEALAEFAASAEALKDDAAEVDALTRELSR